MKTIIAFLLLVFGMTTNVIAHEEIISSDKVYVSYESLAFLPDGIFVNLDGLWMQAAAIHTDSQGFYLSDDKASVYWNCPKCGHENKFWSKTCGGCGYRPQ